MNGMNQLVEQLRLHIFDTWARTKVEFAGEEDFSALLLADADCKSWTISVLPRRAALALPGFPQEIADVIARPAGEVEPCCPVDQALWVYFVVADEYVGTARLMRGISC